MFHRAVILALVLTTTTSYGAGSTAVDQEAATEIEVKLSIESYPEERDEALVLKVELLGGGRTSGLVHGPCTIRYSPLDLAFDLVQTGEKGWGNDLEVERFFFRKGCVAAFHLWNGEPSRNCGALVVVNGREATIYASDHCFTGHSVPYSLKVRYHHFHENQTERDCRFRREGTRQPEEHAEQKWTESNSVEVVPGKWRSSD